MTEHKSLVFKFEDIEVRENDFAFTRAGQTVKVEPTAFRVLLAWPLERMPFHGVPTLAASRDGRTILFTQLEAVTHINLAEASP